jgi:hypothetical protein
VHELFLAATAHTGGCLDAAQFHACFAQLTAATGRALSSEQKSMLRAVLARLFDAFGESLLHTYTHQFVMVVNTVQQQLQCLLQCAELHVCVMQ